MNEKKLGRISLRIEQSICNKIKELAKKDKRTISNFIQLCLDNIINKRNK